jgi:pimeloyl-ACP methyl ester carboxylesterase
MRMMEAMNSGDIERAIRAGYEANLSPTYVADEANWARFREVVGSASVPVQVVMRQAQAAFVHDTSARLGSITAPTLVIAGTADDMLTYVNSELIASLIPGARLLSFDGVGHLFWWERPADTASAVREHCLA